MTATRMQPTGGRLGTLTRDIRRGLQGIDLIGPTLPIAAIVGMYVWLGTLNPNAFSYVGLDLILGSAVPLAFAAVAQSFIITLGDIDLGVGYFVGLTNAIVAIILTDDPLVGLLCLVGVVIVYAAQGALISARGLHSITFTLGSSFVWLGIARYIAPTPKASAPGWLGTFFSFRPPLLPLPVWLILAGAAGGYLVMFRTRAGLLVRSAGSNQEAFVANGGSIVKARAYGYGFAGLFGVLSGLALTGVTRSADVTASADYTLLSVAAVILGGASFSGGKISMFGAVAGAVVFSAISALMTQLNIQSSLQVGARGLALVLVIAARLLLTNRRSG
ncbi:MAG: ABC transporter permease [Acidimicrobiales bacterium]|nr:MAG: ABC transporter permease [Acidimicrobiales bacterium]